MSEEYRVQKQSIHISILMREMNTEELWEGEVFLLAHTPFQTGDPDLEDFLNSDHDFFPLEFKKGQFSLVNKSSVIYLTMENKDLSKLKEYGIEPRRIRVFFKEHHSLEGDIYPVLPVEKRRPLDFFNQKIRFLPLYLQDAKAIINTEQVIYVEDLD
ncbi:MAG: hypothetical protein CSA81_05030 [Acidobacteria bacterium]|nr:MAG: hypothetical protein CSA81_05030 [Acidobacteriota bacterium]PIE91047.1 MAG: hypothetical protein CR997_02705 [Acidobacteriota bacterium]